MDIVNRHRVRQAVRQLLHENCACAPVDVSEPPPITVKYVEGLPSTAEYHTDVITNVICELQKYVVDKRLDEPVRRAARQALRDLGVLIERWYQQAKATRLSEGGS